MKPKLTLTTALILGALAALLISVAYGEGYDGATPDALRGLSDGSKILTKTALGLDHVYDVRNYGAVGDGATDDTTAIQAAATAGGSGATILFPPATYVTGSLEVSTGQTWLGYGATLKPTGTPTEIIHVDGTSAAKANIRIAGFTFAVPAEGGNIISDGGFTAGDGALPVTWSGANWAVSSNTALHTAGSTEALTQAAATVTIGKQYKLKYNVVGGSAGTITPSCGGVGLTARNFGSATYIDYFTATATTAPAFTPSNDFDGAIDNVDLAPATSYLVHLEGGNVRFVNVEDLTVTGGRGIAIVRLYHDSDTYNQARLRVWNIDARVSGWDYAVHVSRGSTAQTAGTGHDNINIGWINHWSDLDTVKVTTYGHHFRIESIYGGLFNTDTCGVNVVPDVNSVWSSSIRGVHVEASANDCNAVYLTDCNDLNVSDVELIRVGVRSGNCSINCRNVSHSSLGNFIIRNNGESADDTPSGYYPSIRLDADCTYNVVMYHRQNTPNRIADLGTYNTWITGDSFHFGPTRFSNGSTSAGYFDIYGDSDVDAAAFVRESIAVVDVTNSQIKDLADTAVTLVATPGSDKWLEFCGASLWLDYGSEVLAEPSSPDDLRVSYTNDAGVAASADIVANGFITAAADTGAFAIPVSIAGTAAANLANKALVLVNTGADYTGNASNDTVIRVIVRYRVHSGLGL